MKKYLSVLLVLGLLTACSTSAPVEKEDGVLEETPEVVDMHLEYAIDESLEASIDDLWNQWMEDGTVPGGVVLAAKDGKIIFEKAYGYAYLADAKEESPYDAPVYEKIDSPREMKVDTMFDLASVTKVMATTQSVMKLISEGKLSVDDKVATYIPGFEANGKGDITVAQLLTHTSGLPQWEATFLYCDTKEEQLEYIKQLKLNETFVQDGIDRKAHHYSDFSFMTLGFIVEAISGMDMDTYVEENIYKPLGMDHTCYNPLKKGFTKDQIAATSLGNPYEYKMVDEELYPEFGYDCTKDKEAFEQFDGWRKETLIGEVNDGNTGMGGKGIAGHAGLFSNAQDLAVLGEVLLNGGEYKGVKIYNQDTVNLFTSKQTNTGIESEEFGYAFKLDQSWMGDSATEAVFGHDGFTGTYVTFDPVNHLQIIILTNKMQSGFRTGENANPNLYWNVGPLAKETANIIRTSLGI